MHCPLPASLCLPLFFQYSKRDFNYLLLPLLQTPPPAFFWPFWTPGVVLFHLGLVLSPLLRGWFYPPPKGLRDNNIRVLDRLL